MRTLALTFFILSFLCSYSQIDKQGVSEINTEANTFAVQINTNGLGISYAFFKRKNALKTRMYEASLNWVKHHKEYRIRSRYLDGEKLVFGKLNQLITFKLGWGKRIRRFIKRTNNGVAIETFYSFGLALGILKPVYYYKSEHTPPIPFSDEEFYTPEHIYKAASFFKGFDHLSLRFGGYLKGGVAFDLGGKARKMNYLELGGEVDVYHNTLPLMAQYKQRPYLLSLFIAYRFGLKKQAKQFFKKK